MRAVVQRVDRACIKVENKVISSIEKGLLIYLGVGKDDDQQDVDYLSNKIANLRIFEDDNGKLNLSVKDINGEILVVSQFTLFGDCRKGRRPNFMGAAPSEKAEELYKKFAKKIAEEGLCVKTGKFQAHMYIDSINNGPVTILIDSEKVF